MTDHNPQVMPHTHDAVGQCITFGRTGRTIISPLLCLSTTIDSALRNTAVSVVAYKVEVCRIGEGTLMRCVPSRIYQGRKISGTENSYTHANAASRILCGAPGLLGAEDGILVITERGTLLYVTMTNSAQYGLELSISHSQWMAIKETLGQKLTGADFTCLTRLIEPL